MELLSIRSFLVVAEHLSFTKAADILCTTQPTVSKRIADLEEDLRVKLFYRSRNFVMLTPTGELLVRKFRGLLKKAEEITTLINEINKGNDGHINIGLHGMMDINRILPNFFQNFIASYPHIRLNIGSYNFGDMRHLLINREVDIIFTYSYEQQNDTLNRLAVYRHNCRVYFAASLKKHCNSEIKIDDLKNEKLVILAEDEGTDSAYDHTMEIRKKLGFVSPDVIIAKSMESMRVYIESGAGICFIGASYRLAENGKIDYIELEGKDFQVGTDALWRKDNHNMSLPLCINSILSHIEPRQ